MEWRLLISKHLRGVLCRREKELSGAITFGTFCPMSDLIDSKEAALMLNVSQPTLSRLVAAGEIPSASLGAAGKRGRRLFSRAALYAFIAKRLSGGPKRTESTRLPRAVAVRHAVQVTDLTNKLTGALELAETLCKAFDDHRALLSRRAQPWLAKELPDVVSVRAALAALSGEK
jgi:excisionase family DNA binding protein